MLRVEALSKSFAAPGGELKALDSVSLELEAGQCVGVVGESGAGKSTLARCILGVERPSGGRVVFQGREVAAMSRQERQGLWQRAQIIWQEPGLVLNPHQKVGRIVAEPLINLASLSRRQRQARVGELLEQVELEPALAGRFPHQLSGGQAQRVCIARALASNPRLLICDEPVSALDLPLQLKVMELLDGLRRELGLGLLLITHDLGIARRYCARVSIMLRGQVVEQGPVAEVLGRPRHEYARQLLAATPRLPW
ncbi:MAG: ATP-binding cassette domain-containing protein [Desulfarculaceae bacterium]|nr:ATP-binding cassette domain-containing protein [Desulfarculaceae bacterium]